MRKRTVFLLIAVTSLALAGIIFIQLYWVRNALRLQEEQFDNKIQLTLKSVVNRMFAGRDSLAADSSVCGPDCDRYTAQVLLAINPLHLDSIMRDEFGSMELSGEYYWGVYNPATERIFAGIPGDYSHQLMQAQHSVSMSCLYSKEPLMLGAYFPYEHNMLWVSIFPYMMLAFLLLAVVIFTFTFTIHLILKQKKLSEMKSDFVNNMTHEFKTPIATISLATDMLLNKEVAESPAKTRRYATIIQDENRRLKKQVEQILQIAVLDKGEYNLKISAFDAHEAILSCIARFELTVRDMGGMITHSFEAEDPEIKADYHHFTNMVNNLLDNAAKYARDYPEVRVSTGNQDGMFFVKVQDRGIGISRENMKHVFKNLYRVPTGNVHDVKGFGLGLYYVKAMAEAHGGYVKVDSELNNWTVFTIYIPKEPAAGLSIEHHV